MNKPSSFSVSIPKPCHEDWNKMTPNEQGAFCSVCSKTVVDFTTKTTGEIKDFFRQNIGQKICGRFEQQQLKPIPVKVSPQRKQWFARFAMALYMVFGSMLFTSCGPGDERVGKVDTHERMGEVAPVPDTVKSNTNDTATANTKLPQSADPTLKGNIKVTDPKNDPGCGPKTMGKPMVNMGDVNDPIK